MEKLGLKYNDATRALATLDDILKEPFSVIVRDAAIQRFEYTFEAVWKYVKEYLKEKEGLIANSPKSSFRELFSMGLASEEEVEALLEMTDRRNDTSHTYKQEVAQMIYDSLKVFASLMSTILKKITP
jgi:nucleotidyltransferase substrate binding protein (TIGR01987 family)